MVYSWLPCCTYSGQTLYIQNKRVWGHVHVLYRMVVGNRAVLTRVLRDKYSELGPMNFHQVSKVQIKGTVDLNYRNVLLKVQ